jgi:short-subunit dehydrogenase
MKALITGASSGIGRDMARILNKKGYDLILVAKDKNKLEDIKKELGGNTRIIPMDLISTYNCLELYNQAKDEDIDILINDAGFGLFGSFTETKLDKELDMIDLNIKALHTLTKLFLTDFKKKDKGYILNVASMAAFMPGPMMATYYATKAYVLSLTEAIHEELKQDKSNVYIGALCPGPVRTDFNKVAKVRFTVDSMSSNDVAEIAIDGMFNKKEIIVPSAKLRVLLFMKRFVSRGFIAHEAYGFQKSNKL